MYLAAGVTTLRTTGSMFPQADLATKRAIDSGELPGPDMFLTAPYLESNPLTFSQMHAIAGPDEAIHIATQNGAEVLGQSDRVGTIAKGKQADLVVVSGDPSTNISDIRNVDLVFRKGVGYSSAKLFGAIKGLVDVQ